MSKHTPGPWNVVEEEVKPEDPLGSMPRFHVSTPHARMLAGMDINWKGKKWHEKEEAERCKESTWVAIVITVREPIGPRGGFKTTIRGYEESKSNAHLIAAAPELLERLEAMVAYCELWKCVPPVVDSARETIRKAKGEMK